MRFDFFRIAAYILLIDMAFLFLYPFLYMVITSIKSSKDLNDFTVNWIPSRIEFKNYIVAFKLMSYGTYFKNSFFVTCIATIGHLLSCSFVGYGLARYNFKGKNILFALVILNLIIPIQTILVPQYMIFSNLKWLDTYLPILFPTFLGYGLKGSLFIFIFRQFYLSLPNALEEAAEIDGCSFFRVYWNIILPVAKAPLLVTLVLSIVWHWSDFYEPTIYATLPKLSMLPSRINRITALVNVKEEDLINMVGVSQFINEEGESIITNAVLMAGTFMVVLPVIIVFSFLQKRFMQGIERTGIVE